MDLRRGGQVGCWMAEQTDSRQITGGGRASWGTDTLTGEKGILAGRHDAEGQPDRHGV